MKPEELAEFKEEIAYCKRVMLSPPRAYDKYLDLIQANEERNKIAEERDEALFQCKKLGDQRDEAIELLRRYVDEPSCQIFHRNGFPDYSAHDFLAEIDKEES